MDDEGRGVALGLASAPVLWFVFTGIVGGLFLLLRESVIMAMIARNFFSSLQVLRMAQAWIAIFVIMLSYGDLMSPFYFVTVALAFSAIDDRSRSALGYSA
jgi:hypothetical protein